NPTTEEAEYVEAIQRDVRWLGFDWEERLFYASGFFAELHGFAVELIEKGLAYVCDLRREDVGRYRAAGKDSPFLGREVADNLDLFRRMRAGEFDEGSRTLR